MTPDGEREQLAALFRRLGADPEQADTMARQTAKRASQLASERGMDRAAALKYLLELVISGREGKPPPSLSGESDDEGQSRSNPEPP